MAELLVNGAYSTLLNSITTVDTQIVIQSAASFPNSGTFRVLVDSELMLVTAVSGTTLTVTRGIEGTTANAHAANAGVTVIMTAAGIAAFVAENAGGGSAFTGTPNQAVATNSTGTLTTSSTTAAELSYVSGVTSPIQTQLNAKANTSSLAPVATSGAYSSLTGAPTLAPVATAGSYSSLTGLPSLGTAAAHAATDFDAAGAAASAQSAAESYANSTFIPTSAAGAANGVSQLDSGGHVPTGQLPPAIVNGLQFQTTWNASTNSPALVSSTGTKGFLYIVSTAGTTTLDGISSWLAGDGVLFDGTVWRKLDGQSLEVTSVAGRTGNVVLTAADIGGLATVATSGSYTSLTGAPSLAPVATSGAYSSLTGLPSLGSAASHASTDFLLSSVVTTAGDLIVGSGSGTVARLGKGTDGYVLTMVSGSVAWASAGGGSLPFTTASDPGSVLKNHAGNVVLATDSNGNPYLADATGVGLVEFDSSGHVLVGQGAANNGNTVRIGCCNSNGGNGGTVSIGLGTGTGYGNTKNGGNVDIGCVSQFGGTAGTVSIACGQFAANGGTTIIGQGQGATAGTTTIYGVVNLGTTSVGFFGTTASGQQAANQAMTDSTGGSPSTTLNPVAGTGDDADINNNFASLAARLAEIRTLLTAYGLGDVAQQ